MPSLTVVKYKVWFLKYKFVDFQLNKLKKGKKKSVFRLDLPAWPIRRLSGLGGCLEIWGGGAGAQNGTLGAKSRTSGALQAAKRCPDSGSWISALHCQVPEDLGELRASHKHFVYLVAVYPLSGGNLDLMPGKDATGIIINLVRQQGCFFYLQAASLVNFIDQLHGCKIKRALS